MLRIRKELIQSRSKVADLQDELEEKTSLYLNAIKVSPFFNRPELSRPTVCLHICAIIESEQFWV